MSRIRSYFFCLLVVSVIATGLSSCVQTSSVMYEAIATVTVFEDLDQDGVWLDGDPTPIPSTLIVAEYNVEGQTVRSALLTDNTGHATIKAEYTHFFYVDVIPPCGYQATTELTQSASGQPEPQLRFGFVPDAPRPGRAVLRFYLWEDRNGNGIQDSGEPPLGDVTFDADPRPMSRTYDYREDGLSITTDDAGRVTLDLGNSCGMLHVRVPLGWRTTTVTPEDEGQEEGWLTLPYTSEATEIMWGLRSVPLQPTPSPFPSSG